MRKRYRFNWRKFLRNVVAPFQATLGLLLLFAAAGMSDSGKTSFLVCLGIAIVGLVLMVSTSKYNKL